MSEPSSLIAHPESLQFKIEDTLSGLAIGHNQAIRTVTIGQTSGQHLARKYPASMLRMLM